jgi:hypothetical protein
VETIANVNVIGPMSDERAYLGSECFVGDHAIILGEIQVLEEFWSFSRELRPV